jgi:hypothetical protein
MKITLTGLFFAVVVALIASGAFAGDIKQMIPFNSYSSASASAAYSPAFNVARYRHKTVQVQGYDMSTGAAAALSGTALVQCGPSSDGPWVTCAQEDGTAISTTANAALQWSDVSAWVRVSWAKTAGKVKVRLNAITD